jgi:hypothetical protein
MRQLALGLLILIAAPLIASADAFDKAEAEAKCRSLVNQGDQCVEYFWAAKDAGGNDIVKRGPVCEPALKTKRRTFKYECNRYAYQDFSIRDRARYYLCK